MKEIPQWAIPMDPVPETQIVKTYSADVVILARSCRNCRCPSPAAEAGAKVLVVEQQQEKRFQVFGAQYGSINSEFMKKRRGTGGRSRWRSSPIGSAGA